MAKIRVAVFVLLRFFSLVQADPDPLRCYSCSQVTESHCKDPFPKEMASSAIECPRETRCTKHVQPAITITTTNTPYQNLTATIIRGCKPKDYCERVRDFSDYCSQCETNLCNSSSVVLSSTVMLFFTLLLANKFRNV